MIRSRKFIVLAVIAALILVYVLYDRCTDSPEKRIKHCIKQAIEAVEHGDSLGLMALVSHDYNDELGLDYMMVSGIVLRSMTKYKDIKVKVANLKIEVTDKNAQATFSVRVDATDASTIRPDGQLPDRPSYYKERVLVHFKQVDDRYLILGSAGLDPKEWGIDIK
jgi:hypothetical protein